MTSRPLLRVASCQARTRIFARTLHYGYAGDSASRCLLVPAIEALVRLHLANAGERTSTISAEGGENEIAWHSRRTGVAYFCRCGVRAPRIALRSNRSEPRNEVAHGLLGDTVFASALASISGGSH